MGKKHITISLLLLASLLLCGCSDKSPYSEPAPGTSSPDISSTSSLQSSDNPESTDPSEQGSPESLTEPDSSGESGTEDFENSKPQPELIPVEFTDEDRELQEILLELDHPTSEIYSWITNMVPSHPVSKFLFPQLGDGYGYFGMTLISDDHSEAANDIFIVPQACAEVKEVMLKYFSEQQTENLMKNFVSGTMSENPDGTFTVTFDDDALAKLYVNIDGREFYIQPKYIEINGIMYSMAATANRNLVIREETAKVISQTDDMIEFSYIGSFYGYYECDIEPDYNNEPYYSEYASRGTLKYERGGWKLDSFEIGI